MRLAVIASHPIQYQAPLLRALAEQLDLITFFAHRATAADQAEAGFGTKFDWDVDLLSGYEHIFLRNVAKRPGLDRFNGCDTPEIARRLRNGRFDAVLVMGWHLKTFVQALFGAKRRGLPVLVRGDSHLGTPRSVLKTAIKTVAYPRFLRLFDAALYVGEKSRAYWMHYGYPPGRLFFSPHCVDTGWFAARATLECRNKLRARFGITPNTKVVLFAGRLVSFKRPVDIIAAAALLKTEGYPIAILVAGSGPLEAAMAAAALKSNVALHRLGFCNQTEMPSAYAAADVLVLPSSGQETWGLVANEALACGLPVVLSDAVGAAPDLAADGLAGRVYSAGDIAALARALNDILLHPPSYQAMATRSAQYGVDAAVEGIVKATAYVMQRRANTSRSATHSSVCSPGEAG